MTIAIGDRLPGADLVRIGDAGVEQINIASHIKGRNVVLFAVPGAFTPTCHSAHMPSFIRNIDALRARGVEEVICISVNDPFVMKAWGEATGADTAGITLLGDPKSELTQRLGLAFDAPEAGLSARSRRYAMQVVDGEVRVLHLEESSGACEISGGEAMLEAI